MTERPDRSELLLKFFPEIIQQSKDGDTEAAIALNVRACEAVLADLIDLYDKGLDTFGPGLLAIRLRKGAPDSTYLTSGELEGDLSAAESSGDTQTAGFLRSVVDAIDSHNVNKAALVMLLDNSRGQVLPIARHYPASSIGAMLEEVAG